MVKEFNGRPPGMVDTAVQQLEANPVAYMGPWFLGLIGLTYMLGILGTQATKYFSTFGYESLHLFLLVVSSILLLVSQWVTFVMAQWNRCVVNYGDWRRFAEVPWELVAFPITSWITIFVSQLFFASRCYTLYGRNKLLFGVLLLGMTASLGMFMVFAATIARDPFNEPILRKSSISGLAVNVATDVAITGLTLWKLGRGGKMYSPQTQTGLHRLRNMTVEAAVPPTICVILNIGSYLGMGDTNQVSVFFAAINPALYVWSMMFTLNSRVAIRQTFNSWNDDEDDTLSAGFQFARPQAPNLKIEQSNLPASKFAGLCKPYSLT